MKEIQNIKLFLDSIPIWLPILISAISLVISLYGFWQQFVTNKNIKANTILKLKEIKEFYDDLLNRLDLDKDNHEILEDATSQDPMFHIVDTDYGHEVSRILEDFKGTILPLEISIVKQITLINKLLDYEKKMDDCIVRHFIPGGKVMKKSIRPGDFFGYLEAAKSQVPFVKKFREKINIQITKLEK